MFLLALILACGPANRPDYTGPGALQFDGPAPRNLIFLSIDTLRRDRIDPYGASGVTPFLDRLAAESLVLDDHQQCSSWTAPGMACTLAGRTNLELGYAPRLGASNPGVPLPENERLLASFLDQEGFWTGVVSSNFWLSPDVGTARGYAEYRTANAGAGSVRTAGLALLEAHVGADRWFLHLHHMEPHAPYLPREDAVVGQGALEPWPEDLGKRAVQDYWRDAWELLVPDEQELLEAHLGLLYEGEIRGLDRELEQTWAELEAGGYLEDALVVVWSDHGEQIFEHGFKGHAHSLHSDENDAVALFWARNIRPGRHPGPTTATDLVPTVLTALELPVPAQVTGLVVGTAPSDRARFSEVLGYGGTTQAVTVEGVKLQYRWDGSLSLFEREDDRAEHDDRYSLSDARVGELWELLEPRVQALSELIEESPSGSP